MPPDVVFWVPPEGDFAARDREFFADPAADFFAEAELVFLDVELRRFGAGPAARRSASISMARCSVIDSGTSPLRSDALV